MITAHPSAPEGEVKTLASYDATTFTTPCIVLCRNTAPLVTLAYAMIQRHVRCCVRGRDIGTQLVTLVQKQKAVDLDDLDSKLDAFYQRETERLSVRGQSPERLIDQIACVRAIMSRLRDIPTATVATLIASITSLFSDEIDSSRVLLSTIHRAKGLEYPTVFILDKHLCPSKYATQEWQKTQERNLMFVAITRSQDRLFYITSDCWKDSNNA